MNLGEIGSMRKLGVTESYKLKRQVVSSASEAAEMILRSAHLLLCPVSLRTSADRARAQGGQHLASGAEAEGGPVSDETTKARNHEIRTRRFSSRIGRGLTLPRRTS